MRTKIGFDSLDTQRSSLFPASDKRINSLLISFLVSILLFNVLDFLTSFFALSIGLAEGNSVLIAIANSLGVNLLDFLISLKFFLGIGAAMVAIMGMKSSNSKIRKEIFLWLFAGMILFLLVFLNNLYWVVLYSV